ncbi:MAG: N-acetyltransferase family protein [Thermomicrobiales bacterium]
MIGGAPVGTETLRARAATVGDAAAIAAIYTQGIEDRVATFETRPRTADDILGWFGGPYPVVVVERVGPAQSGRDGHDEAGPAAVDPGNAGEAGTPASQDGAAGSAPVGPGKPGQTGRPPDIPGDGGDAGDDGVDAPEPPSARDAPPSPADGDARRQSVHVAASGSPGEVVAFAATSEYRPRACYAGIAEFSVYVERGSRGHGAGRLAMAALVEAATAAGFHKLVSRVFVENGASRALLRSAGFREVGTYERHARLDGAWRDVVIVERLLSDPPDERGPGGRPPPAT